MAAVLLVDDLPQNLLALEAILEPLGHELVSVGSGEEALRVLLHRDDFAVILLDVQMPKLDGFGTAAMIKQRERTRNIPIIFLTAISKESQNVFQGYEVGAVDYVFKPFQAEVLRGKVAVFIGLAEKNEELRRQSELTALQELAELRHESAERYRQLADAMPQIVWTADPSGKTTYLNQRFTDYTGVSYAGNDPIAWARWVHPDEKRETMRRRRESLRTGEVFEFECRLRAADGSYRWHLGRAVPIAGMDGTIEFWIGTATDIDERKRAEEEQRSLLKQIEERARATRALETIADGVVLLDTSGVILLWNKAACTITGIKSEDAIGRNALDVISGYASFEERVPLDGSRAETVPVEIDGREFWLSLSGVQFEEGTVYAFRDLTEERALERMRSDLVATVSHELRTPLAAIYGAAVTVRRGDVTISDETYAHLLEIIESESSRLAEIVNDVLVASHLDSGRLQLHIETVDPAKVTEGVIEAARTHLPDGITLEFERPDDLPPIAADEQQLRQVLVNLVDNAIKYSPDGGPVSVMLGRDYGHVRWQISDRGLGIPASERNRVFEKFYRLDPNMTRGIGGTGLGLYICRELVQRLDGRIWVEPGPVKGSTFCVQLPVAADLREPAKQTA